MEYLVFNLCGSGTSEARQLGLPVIDGLYHWYSGLLHRDGEDKVLYYAQLKDQDNQSFFNNLHFIFVVLPHFTQTLEELKTLQDKWFYTFRHLSKLTDVPPAGRSRLYNGW